MNVSSSQVSINLRRVQALYELERYREAVQELHRLLVTEPDNARWLCHLAANYGQLGENDRRLEFAEKALAADPDNEWGHRLRTLALRQKGQKKEALAEAYRAIAAAPSGFRAYHALILCLRDNFRVAEAQEAAKRLRELAPDKCTTYQTLADVALDAGEWAEGEENARQAIALEPEDFRAFRLLGQSLWPQNRQREAVDAYYEASRLTPTNERMRDVFVNCLKEYCQLDMFPEPLNSASWQRLLLWKMRYFLISVCLVGSVALIHGVFGPRFMYLVFAVGIFLLLFLDANPALRRNQRWRELPPAMRRLYLLQRYKIPLRYAPRWLTRWAGL